MKPLFRISPGFCFRRAKLLGHFVRLSFFICGRTRAEGAGKVSEGNPVKSSTIPMNENKRSTVYRLYKTQISYLVYMFFQVTELWVSSKWSILGV